MDPPANDHLQIMKCFCEQHALMASQPTTLNDPFKFKIVIDLKAELDNTFHRTPALPTAKNW